MCTLNVNHVGGKSYIRHCVCIQDEIPRKEYKRRTVIPSPRSKTRRIWVGSVTITTIHYHSSSDQRKNGVSVTTSNEAVATYCERNSIKRKFFDRTKEDKNVEWNGRMQTKGWSSSGRLAILLYFYRYKTWPRLKRIYWSVEIHLSRLQFLSRSICRSSHF